MTHKNGTDELPFDVAGRTAQPRESKRAPVAPSAAHAFCPDCNRSDRNGRKQTGLLRVGDHLIWRSHTVTTWGGGDPALPHHRRHRLSGARQGAAFRRLPLRCQAVT